MKTQRLRDPLHDLIVFQKANPVDQVAWALINQPEFQRLRRIRQLGFSEIVYPGATHTRFAHSIGVFHTARLLIEIVGRQRGIRDQQKESITLLAALLHDVGHGPFSHAFEEVQKVRNMPKRHEAWTIEIITSGKSEICAVLEEAGKTLGIANLPQEVAAVIQQDSPRHIFDAIVSSQFDADRLDYLRRDRLMTGAQAGAIDFQWLLDCLEIDEGLRAEGGDEDTSVETAGFCLSHKGYHPMETFLLGRFHLYNQVYLHKTTRGMERMFAQLLYYVAEKSAQGEIESLGLGPRHPLVSFFSPEGGTLQNYLALDDVTTWAAVAQLCSCEGSIGAIADRLWRRQLFKCLDVSAMAGTAEERITRFLNQFKAKYLPGNQADLLVDSALVSAYGVVRFDNERVHKRIMIRHSPGGTPEEISSRSTVVQSLSERRTVRIYGPDAAALDHAAKLWDGIR